MRSLLVLCAVLGGASCDGGASDPPKRATAPLDAGTLVVVDAGTIAVVAPPAVPAVPAAPIPAPAPVAEPVKEIVVVGPATVTWKGLGNKPGDDKITVRASALTVIAVNARHGSTHDVPIVDGVADFNALPKGELVVRATPQATLFLANESIGTTPPAKPIKLPVGDYTVKLVFQDKVKKARVNVTAGARAEIRMKMTE